MTIGRFQGAVCIITGAGRNIGRAIAEVFGGEGASVVCNDISPEVAEETAQFVRAQGGRAAAVAADIGTRAGAHKLVTGCLETFGRIDAVVHNAGISRSAGILTVSDDDWNQTLGVILTGAYLVGQATARWMVDNEVRGSIVNVVSTSGHRGRAGAAAYCAAKGGLLNLTKAMAIDLAPYGIRVNSVSPTQTGVPVGGGSRDTPPAGIPLGRFGEPQDQAHAVAFLASPQAAFITGADLRVDGGALATWHVDKPSSRDNRNP